MHVWRAGPWAAADVAAAVCGEYLPVEVLGGLLQKGTPTIGMLNTSETIDEQGSERIDAEFWNRYAAEEMYYYQSVLRRTKSPYR